MAASEQSSSRKEPYELPLNVAELREEGEQPHAPLNGDDEEDGEQDAQAGEEGEDELEEVKDVRRVRVLACLGAGAGEARIDVGVRLIRLEDDDAAALDAAVLLDDDAATGRRALLHVLEEGLGAHVVDDGAR